MVSWGELESRAPDLANRGRGLLFRDGVGEGLLTTVAGAGLPRTHPVNVGIVDDRLLVFVQAESSKSRDLETDGRFALHAHQDPAAPHEFLVRGRARLITDPVLRARAAAAWPFRPADEYGLYELAIEHVVLGERGDPNAWPPRYTSWRAATTESPG